MNIPDSPHILSAGWRRIPLRQCQECPKLVPAAQERCNSHERKEA